jgi:flavodoxin
MDRIALIYASERGLTRQVAGQIVQNLRHPTDLFEASAARDLEAFRTLILVAPTHGDAELHDDMESFLQRLTLRGRRYVLCELGNYYGYDEPGFGSVRIMRARLNALDWSEAFPSLSLDALPELDWPDLAAWIERLNRWQP